MCYVCSTMYINYVRHVGVGVGGNYIYVVYICTCIYIMFVYQSR